MDDYAREMMELKTLVTRTLEKKGVLARIRAELRASVFEAIEEEDRVAENNSNLSPALLGCCNDRAKQLHISPSGLVSCIMANEISYIPFQIRKASRLLTALIGEYLDWAQLGHTLKVYLPECNLPRDFWKEELKDFSSSNKNGESGPLLLDVLEGYLKYENLMQNRLAGGNLINSDSESVSSAEIRNVRRPSALSSSSAVPGGLPALDRPIPRVHSSDRRSGSSTRKDDYMWRYDAEVSDDIIQAANALENIHLDRKARNMTTTWRQANDGIIEDIGMMDRQ
ncbi:hypothetical protein ZIOFF_055226 [Zingiber officinale]|uniref:LisH domain-containing protein n=1 Tax=Zingiber officinale TaxID=94328 RepID=A0A8J5KED9_ZINOF|nr:hypothetical protein ZIOFF_055226 [Zingiber officinale]